MSDRAIGSYASVTARLIVLVMVPLTVMSGFAVSAVVARRSASAGAHSIHEGVVELRSLVELHGALETQKSTTAFVRRVAELHVPLEAASTLMGVDFPALTRMARSQATKAVADLGAASPVDAARLEALDRAVDRNDLEPAASAELFRSVEKPLETALVGRLVGLARSARIARADELRDALDSLRLTNLLVDAAAPQGDDLSALWFSSGDASSKSSRAVMARLGAEGADYASAVAQLRALDVPEVVTRLNGIDANRPARQFERAIVAAQGGAIPSAGFIASRAAAVFHGYVERATLINALIASTTASVQRDAQTLAASEHRSTPRSSPRVSRPKRS